MQIKSVRGFRKRSFVAVAGALIVIANGVFGCRDKAVSNQTPESSSSQGLTYVDGTAEMVSNLSTIASSLNPEDNPYANRARAEHFGQLAKSADSNEALRFEFEVAKETVLAGDTIDGILAFQGLLKTLLQRRDEVDPRLLLFIRRQIAIAYLRFGEQSNCIDNHNADSCILPIAPSAVHKDEQGSDFAAKAYIALLKNYPEQLDSRWLLNIALMTLGRYPDEVPDEWLIPPTVFESEYSIPRFRDIAPVLGIDVSGLSGGSVVEDFDGDGYLDIMASSWGIRDQIRYFRNLGNGSFLDMTESAGLEGVGGGLNLVHADYDNDGYPDVFILRGAWLGSEGEHPNSLLRNRGDNTFYDVTKGAGLLSLRPTQTAAWGDFNNDGWVDLFVGNESTVGAEYYSELYVNNQNGTFTNVAEVSGIVLKAYVKGTAWGDYNNDGLLDLYVSCLNQPNYLFSNQGANAEGEWQFVNVAHEAGVEEPYDSFPAWFWDFNNDGWTDIFVSGYSLDYFGSFASETAADYLGRSFNAETPRLYQNNGDDTFSNVTEEAGIARPLFTMGSNFGDIDNDGYLDFYLGTGEPDFRSIIPNRMFRNEAGRYFQDVTTVGGFGHLQKGHGISFGDVDNDGDQDIYAVMGGAYEGDFYPNVFFENPGNDNHYITLFLEGTRSNRSAIGARIKIVLDTRDGDRNIFSTVSTGGSFGSSSLRQEIGLSDALAIKHIEVTWPATGIKQTLSNVNMDSSIRVVEGESGFTYRKLPKVDWDRSNHRLGHLRE